MKTYQHNELIYYWDIFLQMWAVYPEDLSKDAQYYRNRQELTKRHPDFKFKKRIEPETGYQPNTTTEHTLKIN